MLVGGKLQMIFFRTSSVYYESASKQVKQNKF